MFLVNKTVARKKNRIGCAEWNKRSSDIYLKSDEAPPKDPKDGTNIYIFFVNIPPYCHY